MTQRKKKRKTAKPKLIKTALTLHDLPLKFTLFKETQAGVIPIIILVTPSELDFALLPSPHCSAAFLFIHLFIS